MPVPVCTLVVFQNVIRMEVANQCVCEGKKKSVRTTTVQSSELVKWRQRRREKEKGKKRMTGQVMLVPVSVLSFIAIKDWLKFLGSLAPVIPTNCPLPGLKVVKRCCCC